MFTRMLVFLLLFVMAGVVHGQTPVPVEQRFTVDGVDRYALIAAPTEATKIKQLPVLFAFHGHGGSSRQAARSFGYHELWPDAIVVYMQGLPTPGHLTDPEGRRNGWQKTVGDQKDRDLKFFDAVFAFLKKQYPVDKKRVFAAGHSNGGAFTYLLSAERGKVFAAVAPSGSPAARSLPHLKPRPTLHVAGESDPLVRFGWQMRTMNAVRDLNGCASTGRVWAKAGNLVGTFYPSKQGTPFVSLIHPGGHEFPKGASELIVKFFREVTAAKLASRQ